LLSLLLLLLLLLVLLVLLLLLLLMPCLLRNAQVVLVLELGIDPLDGTARAKVRGSGVPTQLSQEGATAGAAEAADLSACPGAKKKKKKTVAELEGWVSTALLVSPAAAAATAAAAAALALKCPRDGSTGSTGGVESAPARQAAAPEAASAVGPGVAVPGGALPSQADRTYAFSCVFARHSEAGP
jgi:hypothetical protein